MENTFLPEGYKEPTKSNYMKLQDGSNVFRVLGPAVVGWEYWVENYVDGVKKTAPKRVSKEETIPMGEVVINKFGNPNINYFWAFPVYSFAVEKIQILEITQATIRQAIAGYVKNPKWGNPTAYNLEITKRKEGDKTVYGVIAEPKDEIDPAIVKRFKDMKLDMSIWMDGKDPFTAQMDSDAEAVADVFLGKTDEVPF